MNNYKLIIWILLFCLICCLSCAMTRYRQFQDERKFYDIGKWKIGVPMVIALPGTSDRSLWDKHWYWTQIPVKYKGDNFDILAEDYIENRFIWIDSVVITLFSSNASYSKKVSTYDNGKFNINYLQQYDDSPVCFTFDTLTISPEEDSLKIDFTVKIRKQEDSTYADTPFSYVLYRYEKTKPEASGGK